MQCPQGSNLLRPDSKHLPRICHRDSNHRHRRRENPVRQDNLRLQANLECQAPRLVPEQSAQQVLQQPQGRVPLPLSHPLRKSLRVF